MAKIKICGITNYNDALDAVNLGADFLGFHFIKESPKKISDKLGGEIILKLPPFVSPVAVFANNEKKDIVRLTKKCNLKHIQFNGDETPAFCQEIRLELGVKVFKFFNLKKNDISQDELLQKLQEYAVGIDYFLFDISYMDGETIKYDFEILTKAANIGVPFFMSGNAAIEDFGEIMEKACPFGIDTDAVVERLPKRKDYDKVSRAVKSAHGLRTR
ncbi:MAG: phosphoribosylanthranilate isomerase [Elusimicrobiota bacterium]|jgi:phosphoribosylanthranilate isomerase|nr:phosphoribosylanthranilate isomerase [Elusimicrobiota bacterium]